MKYLLLLPLLLFISCGKTQKVTVERYNNSEIKKEIDILNLLIVSLQEAINSRIDALEARILVLEGQNLDQRIADLEAQDNASQADLDALRSQVNAHTTQINNLTSQTNLIVGQIQDLQSRVSNTELINSLQDSEIEKLKSDIRDLNTQLANANFEINLLRTDVNSNIASITALNQQVANIQLSLVNLQSQITANKVVVESPCGKEKLQKINGKFYSVMVESVTSQVSFTGLTPNNSPIKVQYCDGLLGLNALGVQICLGTVKFKEIVNLDVSQNIQTVSIPTVKNVYLGELADNTEYISTDGQNCRFKIANGQVVRL